MSANAQMELGSDFGLFIGAGLSYQSGKISNHSEFKQGGAILDAGVVYKDNVEFNANLAVAHNPMLSFDVNGRTYLFPGWKLLYGAGYGIVFYDDERCGIVSEDGQVTELTESGSIYWPHANVGVIYGINDNMDLRIVGVIGYTEGIRYYGEEKNWHFVSQIRASVVWNF